MKDKTALSMHEGVSSALQGVPLGMRRSLTYDNGTENALHEVTNLELGVKSY
jgi:IS30 family transposase